MTEPSDTAAPEASPIDTAGIVEGIDDGIVVVDAAGRVAFANAAVERVTGLTRDRLVGEPVERLAGLAQVDADDFEQFAGAVEALLDGQDTERRVLVETTADSVSLEARLSRCVEGGSVAVVCVVRDVTERERTLETLERQREGLHRLYQVEADGDLSVEDRVRRVLEVGREYLDLPFGFLTSVDGERQEMVHAVGLGDRIQSGDSWDLEQSFCRRTVESPDPVAIRDASEALDGDEPDGYGFGLSCYIGTKIEVGGELYGTFCFAAADARDREFSPVEREFVRLLGQWSGHELERQRFERRLAALNDVAGELLMAETVEEIADIAVATAEEVFDLPVTACWTYDASAGALRPVAETGECLRVIGEAPTFERGEGLVWESFDAGEIRVYEDLRDRPELYNPETPLRSEVHVPLGEYGMLVSGSTEPRGFEDADVELLELLGAVVRDALAAVEREKSLAERGEALQRQNERLEEFARVAAHDLRNPLAGAVGFLEVARETHDDRHFDRVEGSLDRMRDLIDELLDIARGTRQAVDPRELVLADLVEEAWSYLDAPAATLEIADDLGNCYADETRLLQLFGNLFRNAVEHVGDDVTVEVGPLPEGGFYVADDGPGLPPETREAVEIHGQAVSATGTGIGLGSVVDVVEAHGWDLTLADAAGGGACFEIRTGGT